MVFFFYMKNYNDIELKLLHTSLNARFTLDDLFCGHINKQQKYLCLNKYT